MTKTPERTNNNFSCFKDVAIGPSFKLLINANFTGYVSNQDFFISYGDSEFLFIKTDGNLKFIAIDMKKYPHHDGIQSVINSFNSGKIGQILGGGYINFDHRNKEIIFQGSYTHLKAITDFEQIQSFLQNQLGTEYNIFLNNNFDKKTVNL